MGYLAAALIIAGVALFVAAPLAELGPLRRRMHGNGERERLERERGLAVQALRELEFDREMGKLDASDYQTLHAALEERALSAMAGIESLRTQEPPRGRSQVRSIESARAASNRSSQPSRINFCPQCGVRAIANAKFCGECGAALRSREGAGRDVRPG